MEYKVVFIYADGHIEEIDDTFSNEEKAIAYGDELLAQVGHTEAYLGQEGGIFRKKRKPYFMVIEIGDGTYHMVYESEH